MQLEKITLPKDAIKKIKHKITGNDIIASYYKELAKEYDDNKYNAKGFNVSGCYKVWDIDKYFFSNVKDVKRINLCHDKFCLNCQSVSANRRYAKYSPILKRLENRFDIYHVVLTVPNCTDYDLKLTLDKMYKKFVYVVQYLQCKRKAKGINFSKYGFAGGVRSLEITTKRKNGLNEYHPHFHCLFLLKKGIREKKVHINDFSFNKRLDKITRKFSDFEVLLQKCWYLFFNNQKLTTKALENLSQGYSATAEVSNGKYHEVFKYAVKGSFKDGTIFHYDVFKTLLESLHRRKIIQGYGILKNVDFENDTIKEQADEIYKQIITQLQAIEDPIREYSQFNEVYKDIDEEKFQYISKGQIIKDLRVDEI